MTFVRSLHASQPLIQWTTRYRAWVLAWTWLPHFLRWRLPYVVSLFVHHDYTAVERRAWYTNLVLPNGWIIARRLWRLS